MHAHEPRTRVVAFGGGTGLARLLEGLRDREDARVSAIVTVGDDGGSSGRVRRELQTTPPGDIRNCLIALATDRELARIFAYRFGGHGELTGHALGNLILSGMAAMSEDFCEAVAEAGRMLATNGEVHPAAVGALTLIAHRADGSVVLGETCIADHDRPPLRVAALEPVPAAPPGALAAIAAAEVIVLGPGSLFTSTIAAMLGGGTREALARFCGPVIYIANLTAERGETTGFSVADHVEAIRQHGGPAVTDVIVAHEISGQPVGARNLRRLGVEVHQLAHLVATRSDGTIAHAPGPLAAAVLGVAGQRAGRLSARRAGPQRSRPASARTVNTSR